MSAMMIELERDITDQENVISEMKERFRMMKEETIPMGMQELGLESIKLSSGEMLTVTQEVYASIPVAYREQAYSWLEEHNFGSIIKTSVDAEFGKGDLSRAEEALRLLLDNGISASLSRNVHAQTLKAFIKEQMAAGSDIPMDVFGARPTWTTKIKAFKEVMPDSFDRIG
jgi:hypothetical protein